MALALGEIALRTVVRTYSPITLDFFQREGTGPLRLQPQVRRRHASPEWNVLVETNGQGRRDQQAPVRPGQPVVLSLGDSMSFGWGVEYGEAFPSLLEAALGGPERTRVLKASVPGTGTTDQRDLLKELIAEVPAQVVLLSFFVGNDFHDVAAGGAAQYDVVDGALVAKDSPRDSARRVQAWIKRSSYLAQAAAQLLWRFERRRAAAVPAERRAHPGLAGRDRKLREYLELHLREDLPPRLRDGIEATAGALSEMHDVSRRRGARFVLTVIPRSFQVYEEDRRRWQEAYGLRDEDWDPERPQRILASWAETHDAELVDLLPAFREAARQGPRLYFFPDSHLNAVGHAAAARELTRYFREHPIRPPE
jgi:lysophospholipase L1-like esterase